MHEAAAGAAPAIVGRAGERARLGRVLADAKDGRGGALVLRGEAGIGKTALLDHAAAIAGGFRVLRASGVESEAEIPFAALQLLLAPVAGRVGDLPEPHARALRSALGTAAAPTEPLMVGAATLLLLSELADEAPLLCLLDDAHWFDRSSAAALLFAARRLHADPVVAILAARDGDRPFRANGIESLTLPRFDDESAARLLAGLRPLPHDVAGRLIRESGGNPLAIVELAADRPDGALPAPVAPLPAAGRLEEHFRGLLLALPERTRWALLLAAADDRSELTAFAAAAERLGLGVADLEPAEVRRLVRVTAGALEFRHPLVRAAAYQDVPLGRRLATHRALADVLDEARDADRRAWHLAAAAAGADEAAAAALDGAAERAVARGAPAAASRAWERAAALSAGRADGVGRLADAARAAYDAGELDRAQALATAADAPGTPVGPAAEAAWVRAQVAYERDSPARACELVLEAAAPILTAEPERAAAMLAEAAWCARDAADPALLDRCAELARDLPPGRDDLRSGLIGVTALLRGDPASAVEPLRALLRATRDGRVEGSVERLLGGFAGLLIGADDTALEVLTAHVTALRGDGAIGWLPYAMEPVALAHLVTGRLNDAEVTVAEATGLATELGLHVEVTVLTSIAAWLAAVRGEPVPVAEACGHRMAAALFAWAQGVAHLARAEPAAALDRLEQACAGPARFDVIVRAVPDHVEAAVRAGDPDRAGAWLPGLELWAARTGGPAATALALRCAALLDDGPASAERFEESLRSGAGPYDEARTRLAYGEWLRRHRRPSAARGQLTRALATFGRIGAHAWEPRARAELDALGGGETRQRPEPHSAGRLTPQELQVVRLAARGLTNREIAGQLFLSPRTVGHHLYKAYPKLGVARRAELGRLDV